MKRATLGVTSSVLAALALSACSSNHRAGVTASVSASGNSAAVSVSASASLPASAPASGGALAAACQSIKSTISSIPGQLTQAATSSSPAQQVQQTLTTISDQLKSEVQNASDQLKTAVQDYLAKLQQVVTTAEHGKAPDLSALNTSQIDSVCAASGGPTMSAGSLASTPASPSS